MQFRTAVVLVQTEPIDEVYTKRLRYYNSVYRLSKEIDGPLKIMDSESNGKITEFRTS